MRLRRVPFCRRQVGLVCRRRHHRRRRRRRIRLEWGLEVLLLRVLALLVLDRWL